MSDELHKMVPEPYKLVPSGNEWVVSSVARGGYVRIGNALTEQDGDAIVEELNRLTKVLGTDLKTARDRLLADITDAIENVFAEIE